HDYFTINYQNLNGRYNHPIEMRVHTSFQCFKLSDFIQIIMGVLFDCLCIMKGVFFILWYRCAHYVIGLRQGSISILAWFVQPEAYNLILNAVFLFKDPFFYVHHHYILELFLLATFLSSVPEQAKKLEDLNTLLIPQEKKEQPVVIVEVLISHII
ncbi:hypothetical protein ACJX0J_015221, partial [Zea mays]